MLLFAKLLVILVVVVVVVICNIVTFIIFYILNRNEINMHAGSSLDLCVNFLCIYYLAVKCLCL